MGNAEQTNETETQTVNEAKAKLSKSNKGEPLIKGFRDEVSILPLALLQRKVEDSVRGLGNSIQEIQQNNMQSLQYVLQIVGGLQKSVDDTRKTLAAVARLSNISQETLDGEIEKIRSEEASANEVAADKKANRVTVNRAAQEGDTVKISYVGTIDGEAFAGGSSNGYNLDLGSKTFIPGFEDQLVGMSAGETKDVVTTFPNDYGNKELAGKTATFVTTVTAVKEKANIEEDLSQE